MKRLGFTLIELLVVILLIGILTAIGVPAYMNALENNKAEDAASITNMLATANRMYALDHGNSTQVANGTLANSCAATSCPTTPAYSACELVACNYMSGMDFDDYSYTLSVGSSCSGAAACAQRRTSGNNSTSSSPYNGWGYSVDMNGIMSEAGGAPTPSQ